MRALRHAFAAACCLVSGMLFSSHADAQVTVTRTSKVIAGVSPTMDSLWTVNQDDYSIVKRLHPTIGSLGNILSFASIATDPTNGDHYAILNTDFSTGSVLATINIQTGIVTYIGDMNDIFTSLAFNANGSLFATTDDASANPNEMRRVNKTDGSTTPFRTLGLATNDEVIAYNSENHYFYHWTGTAPTTWERFDTSAGAAETLTMTPTPVFGVSGAHYDGMGNFIVSNSDPAGSQWMMWDTLGNIGSTLITFDGGVRGLVSETHVSSITSAGPVAICPGSAVKLTVTGGTGGYQWYRNGILLPGETADTIMAAAPGVYNSVYADINGVIDSPTTGINVTYLESPSILVAPGASVCFGATSASVPFTTATNFSFSPSSYSYTVPADVTTVTFDISGGAGGHDTSATSVPGLGGRVTGVLNVTEGDVLTITTGDMGSDAAIGGAPGGSNGGGASFGLAGSGGGATDIRLNGTTLADRVAVAGGGAGAGYDTAAHASVAGGNGGGTDAMNSGMNSNGSMAIGGNQAAGGAGATFAGFAAGDAGSLGMGGNGSADGMSGGGGGGYYGGGGGAWSGGGGGSSYTDATAVTAVAHTIGHNNGSGYASVSYPVPSSYSYTITWDAAAAAAGFADVTPTAFPSSPSFAITVPSTATPDTYTGTLVINNGICSSSYPISIEVKPIPDVTATPDQAVCNGASTTDVLFSGSLPFTVFNWTNSKPSIGIAGVGAGDISSFTGTNTTSGIDTGMIIVTPELNGCFGTPDTFNMIVFPSPMLSLNPANVCDNALLSYTAASATAGTTFAWERTAVPAGLTTTASTPASGTNTISETFDNTTANVIPVAYTFTLTANGCSHVQTLNANVNPTPVLFPTPLTGSICDGATFTHTQNSMTPGVVYSWSRAAVTGITPATGSGTGNISEMLDNSTANPLLVTYVDTLNINGCINTQLVSVTVNPTPVLTSTLTASVCNNSVFDYNATTATTGATITWTRAVVPGISSTAGSGPDTVNETHMNTTDNPIAVVYDFTLTIDGCSNTQAVTLTVNPTPHLNTSLTPAAICDSSFFDYEPGSNTTGATFSWTRAVMPGISNAAAFGTGNPNERLVNTTNAPVVVTYVFTTTINGCSNSENVSVTVNPRPRLSNSSLTFDICDSTVFSFTPASTTLGAAYTWSRAFVSGIGSLPATGTGPISELLKNNTNTNVTVPYVYTITANGCSRNQVVSVVVHPKPELSSSLTDSACSGVPFVYDAQSLLFPPHTMSWSRAAVTNITPATGSGTGDINETLINGTNGILNVVYVYTVSLTGTSCSRTYNLSVKVRPAAAPPVIATSAPSSVCAGTLFQNYGAATPAATGNTYTWSATNAEVFATGAGNQYVLVHFRTPGTAVITLSASVGVTGCVGVATHTVTVGADSMSMPRVIYTSGAFICLANNVKTFQWGYDDSTSLDSTILVGEKNQSYFNKTPNWARNYWVMVNDGDCTKKAYYNAPRDNTPREVGTYGEGNTEMTVFPNPANDNLNIEVTTAMEGRMNVQVSNMLGQLVSSADADARKVTIEVAALPAGMYLVDCYIDGIKVGTAKFVKN